METIGDLLSRDLNHRIEEVIQVHQADQQSVYSEVSEYVATTSIQDQYALLLKAIAEAPAEPHEAIGVWISGFFGSGKSSFAKNLGYALKNPKILNDDFARLFKRQVADDRVDNLLDLINAKIPTEVILFEVAKEKDTRRVTERIAELMYVILLRELGYAEEWDIAELEIELEAEGRLQDFVELCQTLHKRDWTVVRSGAQRVARASAMLHHLDPATYPSADSWSHSRREPSISVSKVVERTFELARRRRPGKALVFIIDEVGQHVARSGDKIEDLRATVEEFGKIGKNLLKARKIAAPCWIVVTSQEKLDEVVAAIDSKRVELAKLQDRFHYRVDLAPSDIREVATKRVLAKKEDAVPILNKLYSDHQGQLNAALRLERTTRKTEIGEADFVHFYPYPPHYIDLCIGIMSGIRLQPGAPRHYGGSNRTIIKQAYEMLVSDRTAMATKRVGTLVTPDKVYELVEGNLSSEKRADIHEIGERFKDDPEDQGWALRVAKAVCLLEFLRDLPRTEANIAAFLVDRVGLPAPLQHVQAAVKKLDEAQFLRETEDGWKLMTLPEKNWEKERNELDPRPRDRNEITRKVLREIFGEPALRTYRHKELRNFRIGLAVEGMTFEEGDLTLTLCIADEPDDLSRKLNEVREESRQKSHANDLYWVFALTPEIDTLVAQTFAARKMVEKYDQMRAQSKINADEATCLQDEKNAVLKYESRLGDKLTEAMELLIREIAFTHLNRLCAYKMMEVRDVYVGGQKFREAVSKGGKSQGFLFYLADHPEDEKRYNAGDQEGAYRHFLNWLGGTLSQEIGVLFSPTDPANLVYPPQRLLDEVLDLLNSEELKGIWSEDETIGWVYQYFTPKELRDQARKESQAPRNSYELAFRNQFFTPRYVVEFLTDNTLGRIWYEMRKGKTKLKDQCRYMVRRPSEVFVPKGSVVDGPSSLEADTDGQGQMTNDELLKLPVYIPHRPKKDPREIKILDPACGSGHFLLYCFGLLVVIYEEAYDDIDLGTALRSEYPTKEDLHRALPGLILRHNLHGIDIDLRAVQIAGLALWLRCQRYWSEVLGPSSSAKDKKQWTRDQGLRTIRKSNVVCAEPMPGEER